jgi:hypothetical protein
VVFAGPATLQQAAWSVLSETRKPFGRVDTQTPVYLTGRKTEGISQVFLIYRNNCDVATIVLE